MNTTTLNHREQRGTLTYMNLDTFTHTDVEGWFTVDNGIVSMRKIGGRNTYRLCLLEQVSYFIYHVSELD